MDTDQFAKLALGEAKCSPSGSHHDGQMGPPALFSTGFNNFFTAHASVSSIDSKSMKYNENYIKNGHYINGCGVAFGSIPAQIVSKSGLIFVFDSIHS
jgi:hypothetical protein